MNGLIRHIEAARQTLSDAIRLTPLIALQQLSDLTNSTICLKQGNRR